MRKGLPIAALLLAAATIVSGCGSGTRTVTVSSAPRQHVKAASHTGSSSSSGSESTSSTQTTETQTTTTTTRTSTAPQFVTEENLEQDVAAAVSRVREAGYTPLNPSEYHAHQTLQVLVGSAEDHKQHAFFFLNGKYLGTDAAQPSGSIKVLSQKDTEVTLAYQLYRPSDSLCCPSGGEADVTFQLDNGKLVPLQKIPPASSSTGLSRT